MAKRRIAQFPHTSRENPLPEETAVQGTGYAHRRGEIKENHLQALLTDPLFRSRVEQNRKGKGSYQRKAKHARRWEPGQQQMVHVCC
ncbi:ribosome alternative rescue factor ArfA [Aeromonas enteropelogenes]|uniref:alternative ribosome-rescue factor A n=1 Tax=Aeromonas TaxID=642 RepID=UPI0005A707B6|nr:ribosome alternative rescue factor ArfA [Aeromonas enteropelogenes]MBL0457538.1 ribosome alternative rescue factor ArfA [Aeromonas enteropelogenes]MBL0522018.1 ribosome alternative rescue factor ArfA [Aeromonas enteropelogenes]